jgi:UDP-3-O-[3-hydroxymyristoyl] glucosamine N-acyltransferase
MKLSQLASYLPDCQLELQELDPEITGVAAIELAQTGDLAFLGSAKYLHLLQTTAASAVIIDLATPCPLPCLRTVNPRLSFAHAIALFDQPVTLPPGVHATAVIGQDVRLGKDVAIAPNVVIGDRVTIGDRAQIFANATIYPDVAIGDGTVIHANCIIRERTQVGAECIIHAGAVIGSDGFGYEIQPDGNWYKIPQSGYVVIGDRVEIGSLSAVDRPSVGTTNIGYGTKIDNLAQIGHGCQIAPHCMLVAQIGLAGGVKLGHHVVLAGQVGVTDHATIGDRALVGGKAGVISDVEPGKRVMGFPAIAERDWKRAMVAQRHLPEMSRTLKKLEQRIAELEAKLGDSD